MLFLSEVLIISLHKSIVRPYIKHSYFWVGAPTCYVDLLGKLRKQLYRTVSPGFLEPSP